MSSKEREPKSRDLVYSRVKLMERIAHLFRIYPAEKPVAASSSSSNASSLSERQAAISAWEGEGHTIEVAKKSVIYVNNVVRRVQDDTGTKHMWDWFGNDEHSTKTEVLRVLNSIVTVLSGAEFIHPGPRCKKNVYAYVYPNGTACQNRSQAMGTGYSQLEACATIGDRFAIYLCDLYKDVTDMEKIEVLTHEASHHATAYTDDYCITNCYGGYSFLQPVIAYGRDTCKDLAKNRSKAAVTNADNYCYYIADVAGGETCHESSITNNPNMDGDCHCEGQCTSTSTQRGCYSSRGNMDHEYFYPGCKTCKCVERGTATYTTFDGVTVSRGYCPSSASSLRADSDGDCQCASGRVCVDAMYGNTHYVDCTMASGSESSRWFRVGCSTCKCVSHSEADSGRGYGSPEGAAGGAILFLILICCCCAGCCIWANSSTSRPPTGGIPPMRTPGGVPPYAQTGQTAQTAQWQILEVAVPDGVVAGQDFQFQHPDGRFFEATAPADGSRRVQVQLSA